MATTRAAAVCLLLLAPLLAAACTVTVGTPQLVSGPASGTLLPDAYTAEQVLQHFQALPNPNTIVKTTPKQITFACVDSRNPAPYARSFGGDMAELIVGIAVYLNQTEVAYSQATVDELLWGYMDGVKSFYYHTSEARLNQVYAAVNAAAGKNYVVIPDLAPTDETELAIWYDALSQGVNQGCGHLSLLIQNPTVYGLANADMPRAAIRAFFGYWWPTPLNDKRRARANFVVYQGGLTGRAVAVVETTADSKPSCIKNKYPAVTSAVKGSQLFSSTPEPAADFRAGPLTKYFAKAAKRRGDALDETAFSDGVAALSALQAAATLRLLSPANSVNIYSVPLTVK